MKRTIYLILLILWHIQIFSQNIVLPTNFWGLEIGKANYGETLDFLKSNGFQYEIQIGDESHRTAIGVTKNLFMEGIEWPVAYLGFENDDILSDIMFTEEAEGIDEAQYKKFKEVCERVVKKYDGCKIRRNEYDVIRIEDDITYLIVGNKTFNGANIFWIQFADKKLKFSY